MPLFRSKEMLERYKEYQRTYPDNGSCVLCGKTPLKEFKYWKIINNDFPYDLVAKKHHMILPIRHATEAELNSDEVSELLQIKHTFDSEYDFISEPTPKNKSIPAHHHLHLIEVKDLD